MKFRLLAVVAVLSITACVPTYCPIENEVTWHKILAEEEADSIDNSVED